MRQILSIGNSELVLQVWQINEKAYIVSVASFDSCIREYAQGGSDRSICFPWYQKEPYFLFQFCNYWHLVFWFATRYFAHRILWTLDLVIVSHLNEAVLVYKGDSIQKIYFIYFIRV